MKIRLSFLLILLFATFTSLKAAFVEKETARTVAKNFVAERIYHHQLKWNADDVLISDVLTYEIGGLAAYYVFSNNGSGFIIVSADDQLQPVLGYSDEGNYPVTGKATNFDYLVHTFANQVQYVRSTSVETPAEIASLWQKYQHGDLDYSPAATTDVQPLLMSVWDQVFPYNAFCPADQAGPGGHALTGCVATAMSQIMYYHRFPLQGNGSRSYYIPGYGTLSANFGATYYNWDEMLNELTSGSGQSIPAVALLNYHAGVSVSMSYGPNASGAQSISVAPALKNYFRYSSDATYTEKGSMTQSQWENQFVPNLDQKMPVYMSGYTSANEGHAWVCDGYQVSGSSKMFHMNFGWGGYGNGYFTITDPSGFTNSQACIKNIHPGAGYPYGCSAKTITGSHGTFEDGSGSMSDYNGNQDCTWLIAPQDSVTKINLKFNLFNVHTSDSLFIYDGEDISAPLLAKYTGSSLPAEVTSSSNRMFLRFVTDGANSASGWQAEYTSTFPVYCSGTVTLSDPTGSFSDGSGDKNYNNNTICKWKITPLYAMNLTLSFTSFNLDDGDEVLVYSTGGSSGSQLMGTYTGSTIPNPIVSTGTGFLVMFKSNTYNTASGFDAQYSIGNVDVDEKAGINGIVIAPNPASRYTTVRFYINNSEPFRMNIIDMAGKEMYKESFSGAAGNFVKNIDLSNFNKGMYFLTIRTSTGTTTRKFIVK